MRNGVRRFFSLMAAGIMAISLFTVGGTGSISEAETLDSASNVNYSSVLGRAINFGIVSDTFELNNHAETNFAVNTFVNVKNDVIEADLAGDEPMYFVVGDIKAGEGASHDYLRFGNATYKACQAEFHFDTTTAIKNTLSNTDKMKRKIWCDTDGNPAIHAYTDTDIPTSIETMVKHIEEESKKLSGKTSTIDVKKYESDHNITDYNQYVIDLTEKTGSEYTYKDKVVYINIPEDSVLANIFKNSGLTEALRINKPSSTVVVFNFNGWEKADVKGPIVHVVDKDYSAYESSGFINSKTGNGSWDKNAVVDSEIAQKIIWNLPDATKVEIREAAGAILVPNKTAKVSVESTSSGWVATGGTFRNNNSEWHYIYMGRQKAANGEVTFAGQKKFTRSYDQYTVDSNSGEKELLDDTTVSTVAGEFQFKLYKSDANFTINESNLLETVSTTATNSFEFSKLTFTAADAGKDFYYVIKEDPSKTKTGVSNTDGAIDIKIHVDVEGSIVRLKVSSWKYLTASDRQKDNKATATSVKNSTAYRVDYDLAIQGTQFRVGSIYNIVNKGSLEVKKSVTGAPKSESGKAYSFTVTNSAGKWINADGTVSDTQVTHTIKGNETKKFDNLAFDTYTITEDETKAAIENCTLEATSVTSATAKIDVAGETEKVELKNVYKQDTGILNITKKVVKKQDSIATASLPTSYQFAVKNSAGNYITDINGTEGSTTPFYFPAVAANGTLKISNLPVGKYTIEEKDARVDGLTLEVTGLDEAEITKNVTKSVDVTNTYETPKKDVGELHIKKVTTGDTVPAGKTFPVSVTFDKDGSYAVNVNGTGSKMVAFKAGTPQIFDINYNGTIDIVDILLDTTYTVEETISAEDTKAGYSKISISNNSNKKIDTKDQSEEVTITNKYTKKKLGNLELIKTIEGELTKEEREGKLQFTVTGPDNYNETFRISETAEKGLKLQSDGTYKLTLTDVPEGVYSVTETTETIEGKKVSVSYYIGTSGTYTTGNAVTDVSVTDGKTTVVNFKNVYSKAEGKGSLSIRKKFYGDEPEKDFKDKVTFSVAKDGVVVKTVTYKDADALGTITITDLDPGTYTVIESQYVENGKTVTVATQVTVPGKSAVNGTSDSVTVEVVSGDTSGALFENTYKKDTSEEETTATSEQTTATSEQATTSTEQATTIAENVTTQTKVVTTKKTTESDDDDEDDDDDEEDGKGNLIVTIYDEKTGNVVPGAKITLTKPNGSTKKYVTDTKGQVSIKNTPAGDYTVTVTEVPKGYTVTENAEVDVEVVKNKTTKAQVKIDKDGEVSVTSKITKSASKTGDSVPIIPVASAFVLALLGLVILNVKRRREA